MEAKMKTIGEKGKGMSIASMNPDYLYWINKKRVDAWHSEEEEKMNATINACRHRSIVRIFTMPNRMHRR